MDLSKFEFKESMQEAEKLVVEMMENGASTERAGQLKRMLYSGQIDVETVRANLKYFLGSIDRQQEDSGFYI